VCVWGKGVCLFVSWLAGREGCGCEGIVKGKGC